MPSWRLSGGLPPLVQTLLRKGRPWALGGAVAGLLLGVFLLGHGAGTSPMRKACFLLLLVLTGAAGSAGWHWGRLAGRWGGTQGVRCVIRYASLPFYVVEWFFGLALGQRRMGLADAMTKINCALYSHLSALFAGLPYLLYIWMRGRPQIGAPTYILLACLGAFPALIVLSLLVWTGSSEPGVTGSAP